MWIILKNKKNKKLQIKILFNKNRKTIIKYKILKMRFYRKKKKYSLEQLEKKNQGKEYKNNQ